MSPQLGVYVEYLGGLVGGLPKKMNANSDWWAHLTPSVSLGPHSNVAAYLHSNQDQVPQKAVCIGYLESTHTNI